MMRKMSSMSHSADAAPTTSGAATDDDVLMTRAHKQLITANKDSLVENMYPDDVLNRLQARKILTTRDVARIREKGGIDTQNETLLDVLLRKPDRAFEEFVASLRETDQGHVANIIVRRETPQGGARGGTNVNSTSERLHGQRLQYSEEEVEEEEEDHARAGAGARTRRAGRLRARSATPGSGMRRRVQSDLDKRVTVPAGAVGVRIQASAERHDAEADDEDSQAGISGGMHTPRSAGRLTPRGTPSSYHSREDDLTAQINDEILETSLIELQNLRDIAQSGITTQTMSARKRILKTLGQLQKMRREILGAYDGSVIFLVACPTVEALDDLRTLCEGGKLRQMFEDAFITEDLKRRHRVKSVKLTVTIRQADYLQCRKEILASESCPEKREVKRSSSLKENECVDNMLVSHKTPDFHGNHSNSPKLHRHSFNAYLRNYSASIELSSANSRSSSGVSSSSFLSSEDEEDILSQSEDSFTQTEDNLSQVEHSFGQTEDNLSQVEHSFGQTEDNLSQAEHSFGQTEDNLSQAEYSFSQTEDNLSQAEYSFSQTEDNLSQPEDRFTQTADKGIRTSSQSPELRAS